MKKTKIVAVSYLNTKPLLYGLLRSKIAGQIELDLQIPSECARRLKSGEADIGLVPVAIIPELHDPHIISEYCIGTKGTVRTVCLYSEVPIEQVERVFLDYHSRTSVELTKILLRDYWKLSPELVPATAGFERRIGGRTAGLVIGDRAIEVESNFPFVYDLGEAWLAHTGLPFVFAAWVSEGAVAPDFLQVFNEALEAGMSALPDLKYLLPSPVPGFDLHAYFTQNISYELDEPKLKALKLFLSELGASKYPVFELRAEQTVG
jgi:chorismate dehydratase